MSIDEIVKNFINGKSGIVEYLSLEGQDEIVNKIIEKNLDAVIIESYKDWIKKASEFKTRKRIIVKDAFKILEKAKNGNIFAKAEKGIFLFFINSELKDIKIIKEWRSYLDSLDLGYKFSFDYSIPNQRPKELKKNISKKNKKIICYAFIFIILGIMIKKQFLPIILSVVVLLVLVFFLIISQIRLQDPRTKFWLAVVIILAVIDQVFGVSFVEIANTIYNFLKKYF